MLEWINGVKEFGFAAVAFVMMFWLNVKVISANTKAINKLSDNVSLFGIRSSYIDRLADNEIKDRK